MPAVQMQATAQDVLARLVDDLSVREVRFSFPFRELVRIPTEFHVDAEFRGLAGEIWHRERVPTICHEDVRVLRPYYFVDAPHDRLLVPVDLDLVEARAK